MPSGIYKHKKHSEETKQKLREAGKKENLSPETIQKKKFSQLGKKHTKETKNKIREWNIMNPNRKFKNTGIELKVEAELKQRSIFYEKQVSLCKVAIVDFYLPEYRIVIQCDGCYWHGCKECNKYGSKDSSLNDKKQDSVLSFNGFNVYRFWEHEINKSVEKCINKIEL